VPDATPAPPPAPPRPVPDELTKFFWEGAAAHELRILQCQGCGKYLHPPRPICRFCLSTDVAPARVSGRATLYTWTVAEQAFHPFFADKLPYAYAVVELEEQAGLRLITNVVGCSPYDLEAGMALEVTFREVAPDLTLPLFRPPGAG
jgi:uncharacterized OB-fold protein